MVKTDGVNNDDDGEWLSKMDLVNIMMKMTIKITIKIKKDKTTIRSVNITCVK